MTNTMSDDRERLLNGDWIVYNDRVDENFDLPGSKIAILTEKQWEKLYYDNTEPERIDDLKTYDLSPGGMHYYLNNTTWAKRCVPHLDDPELRRILHREFGLFVISHYGVLKGHRMPGDFETWANKARPPWWKYVKDLACHYLVNVNLRLAMLAQPDRPWRIVTSGLHSTVWDGDKSIFDLNYSGGTTPADQTLLLAAGIWGGIAPGYTNSDYVDPLPVGEYMPLGIFFPSRNEAEWAQWEKGIEATPALRLALLKGLRRGHLAYLVNKPNYPRALKILNRGCCPPSK